MATTRCVKAQAAWKGKGKRITRMRCGWRVCAKRVRVGLPQRAAPSASRCPCRQRKRRSLDGPIFGKASRQSWTRSSEWERNLRNCAFQCRLVELPRLFGCATRWDMRHALGHSLLALGQA
jgi:hypothetical protein